MGLTLFHPEPPSTLQHIEQAALQRQQLKAEPREASLLVSRVKVALLALPRENLLICILIFSPPQALGRQHLPSLTSRQARRSGVDGSTLRERWAC